MRAAVLAAPGRFELSDFEPPVPSTGEILIRVHGCGVCGSNLPPWSGAVGMELPLPPGAPGHEAFGRVVARGEGVDGLEVGELVTGLTYRSFAELDVAAASEVVAIPDSLEHRGVVGEPLACAVNVVARAGIREGDFVVVVGSGFLGALVLQLARRARPRALAAISRRPFGRDLASRSGADHVLAPEEADRVGEMSGGRLADVVIEVTGYQAPLDLASRVVGVRGRLVIAGYHQTGRREVDMQLWNWKGIDVINAHERDPAVYRRGMLAGIALLEDGSLELESLLTHRYPLEDINEAFRVAREMPHGFVKAMVENR